MTTAPQFQGYLDGNYKNLDVNLEDISVPEPPTDDSHTTRMELEELEQTIQEAKLPREIMRVADRDPLRLFYSVAKKKGLDPLEEEAKEWADDWTKLSFEFKLKFKRRRPWEVKKEHDIDFVVNKSDTTESPSYPSGHAMMGYGVAEFYKDKYPLMADEWDNVAEIIAHSRLQMGVHYPSDVEASKKVVEQLVGEDIKTASLLDIDELLSEDSTLTKVASYANFLTRLSPEAKAAFRAFRGRGKSQTSWIGDFNKWMQETGQDVKQVFSNQRDSRRYSSMNSSAYQDYVNYTTQNRGATYGDWRMAGGSRGGDPLTPAQVTRNKPTGYTPPQVKSTTNTVPKSPVTVSSSKQAPGQGVSSISQPVQKASPTAPAATTPATTTPATTTPATPQTWGQKAKGLGNNIYDWAGRNPMHATAAGGATVAGGVIGANKMTQTRPTNPMPKFGSLGHLEQRRSERAKFMSKEDLASLEKKVRRSKGLPEGAHYITLPHGRKGVVRTEEGKSHLATILDARMRPPGRDISSKVKTAAEKLRLYHGSPHDLETLEPRQPNKGAWGESGLYGSPNQLVAALYAIARNDSRGSWGILPDGRLIAKSKKELNPEGYVYAYDSDDYIPPPEDDPGIGYASQSSPEILSKEKVYLDELRDSITRVDDREKFLEYFKKTSSDQPLLRHRATLLIRDPETGKLLAAKEPPNSNASPFYFPGGGLYDDEYGTPRNPSDEDIIEGARREALEELGIELDNPRVVGSHAQELEDWWKAKTLKNRGVPYVGGHEHYVLADKGKEDRSLYNVEGDAFEQGDYYDPKEIVEALSRAAKGDSTFAPFNREQVRAIKDNLLKKNASDLSVLTAVPTKNLDMIMRKGLYSQKAMLDDPEVMAAFLAQRNADKAWKNDEQYDEKRFREQYDKRVALMEGEDAPLAGPSVFFTEPDPDKVSDPRHFVNKFDTQKLRVNLGKLLADIPETRITGAELIPSSAAENMSDEEFEQYVKDRRRDITPEEAAKYIATDPKELWKHYKDEYIGKYYAADVPHAFIRTPSGIIPPEYLEQVEKTSSAKEQLKHILVTGHSGAGKTTYSRQLAEELGIPLHRLDVTTGPIMEAEYPEYWDKGTLGYPEDVSTRVIQQALNLDKPHVIEGSHILEIPELTEGYKRILIDTPEDRVVEQRAQREYRNQGRKGKPYRPIEKHREAAQELVDHYRDIVTNFRNQPGVESIVPEVKQAALEDEFQPDLTPDDLKALGVYDQVYGDAPSEASMKEWPEHWINKQDPLGWLQWYDRYSGGRRTDDDERQMKRWKSFKARHLAQYLKKPTPRRAAALRNWGIDVGKY